MSWNQYTDYLRANNVCEYAAILGKADGNPWAVSVDGIIVIFLIFL